MALAAAVIAVSVLVPSQLFAAHQASVGDGSDCSECHSLSASGSEPSTSYIIKGTRTLTNMKTAFNPVTPTAPDTFGCTFCHNNPTNTEMKGVLNHFSATSRHPIGETFNGWTGARTNTNNEYLSNRNGNTGNPTGELECVDCHDVNLTDDPGNANYLDHVARATRIASGNLYMLKNVTVAGQYDALCRLCHGSAVATYKGFDLRIKSHKDGSDATTNAIKEADGTILKTSEGGTVDGVAQLQTGQCTSCHDAHYSNLVELFKDGKSGTAINGADCTTVCHYAGDYTDNFNRHGHGKATSLYQYGGMTLDMNMTCVDCHAAMDTTTVTGRKPHAEKAPTGTIQAQYKARYNLSKNVQSSDLGTPSGNPVWGICISCHSLTTYKAHYSGEGNPIGCQDCHDEHAEGSGIASNLFMIPEKSRPSGTYSTVTKPRAGVEPVYYTVSDLNPATMLPNGSTYDFYRADGAGVCDNTECHGATTVKGVTPGPLGTLMASNNHSGGNQSPNIDCEGCHNHNASSGGWRGSCTQCHGNTVAGNWWPDDTAEHGTAYPNRGADHATHINAIAIARYGATPTISQKNTTCDSCHPSPGSSGHDANTAGSLANAADVHRDPQNLTTHFKNIMGTTNGVLTETYNNVATAGGKTCANVDCHYRVTSPTAGTAPDGWFSTATVTCSSCHGNGVAGAALPNSHPVHVTAAGKAFGCWYCHPSGVSNASYTVAHQTGSVNLNFSNTLDPAAGGPRTETYAGSATATRPVTYGVGPFSTCAATYCHGNFTNGRTANAPTWGTVATGDCGSCHDADGSIPAFPTIIASGNHTDHLSDVKGPLFGNASCAVSGLTGCHTAATVTTATHVDGSVQFGNIGGSPAASTLGATAITVPTTTDTDRCTYCHGTATVNGAVGTVLAKANWATAAYAEPCLNCHAGTGGGTQFANGTGMLAPNELGDDVNYGAEVKGHNRPTAAGSYTDADAVTTNVAANKTCTDCHSATVAHINGSNDTTYSGQRLLATINGVASITTVTGACNACHATGGTTPATSLVSTHGNSNTTFTGTAAHDAGAETFVYKCEACHSAHGMTNGTGFNNIYMIKTTIGVGNSFTSAPGGTDVTTIANIRFERVSGLNSMDDGLTTADNVCYTCHTNLNRPGSGTPMRTAGGDHTGNAGGYTGVDTTKNCAACHVHNYDSIQVATPDGFAPQQCNSCHGYPGLGGTPDKTLSGVHNAHVNAINDATPGYGISCNTCHYLYSHNQSNYTKGAGWTDVTVPPLNINVRFDPARNAGANLTYNGVEADAAAAGGVAGTHNGACANLYCHGQNTTSQTDWAVHAAPAWATADPARLACTGCHADVPTTGAHLLHVTNNQATDRTDCNFCHTSVGLIDATTPMVASHVDGTTNVLLTWTGATAPLYANGYCSANTCHGSSAADGFWTDTVLNCDACHYFNTAGNPSDVTNTAGSTFRPISEASHDGHFAATGRTWSCNDCHPNNTTDTTGAASSTIGLVHLTAGTGTDAAILQPKAIPVQDNALISTTTVAQWWNAAADWVDAANTCANKCHNPAAGAYLSTAWGTTSASCSFCHAIASPGPATGSHAAHMNAAATYGQVMTCTSCHPDWQTVPNYGHMSGSVNLTLAGLTYGGGGNLAIPYGAPFGTCATTTCHNNGLGVAVVTSTWGTAVADPNCAICHAATPATPATNNAHVEHMAIPTYACVDCHAAATAATHVDGSVSIKAGLAYSGTVVVGDAGYGSCSTGSCHNATTNVTWNVAATSCDNCHLGAADAAEWNGQNKTASMMNSTEYTAAGHGAKAVACLSCHDLTLAHDTTTTLSGTNPFRLKDQDGGTAGIQFSCSYTTGCHPAATVGPRTGLALGTITTHSSAAMTASGYAPKRTWNFSPDCMNCHDPHGDGTNLSMVSKQLYDKSAFTLPAGAPPAYPTEMTTLQFTDDTTGASTTSYANNAVDYSGLCQECHERATASGGVVAWHDGAAGSGTGGTGNIAPHTSVADCSGCHKHDSGFKPSGCDGCHGNGAGSNAPDSNPSNVYEDRAGAHAKHITAIGLAVPAAAGNNSCTYCHPGNPPAGHSTDTLTGVDQAEVIRMSTDGTYSGPPTGGDFWRYSASASATSGTAVYFKTLAGVDDTDGFYNSTTKTCLNVNCHGSQTTPSWLPDTAAPTWNPSYSITATGGVGFATLSWNGATDASSPVVYDLYASTTNSAASVFTGPPIQTDITGTTAVVARTAGTWYFGVRAKDSAAAQNSTSGETISTGAVVTAPAGVCAAGTSTTYYVGLIGALPTIPDGTYNPTTTAGTYTVATNTFGREPISAAANATAQDIRGTMPTAGAYNRLARFYLPAFANPTCVGPNLPANALNGIAVRSSSATDSYQVNLVDYDPAGVANNGTIIASSLPLASATAATQRTFTMTFAQTQVQQGHMLVLEVMGRPISASNVFRIYMGSDATTTARTTFNTPIYTATPEAVPPVWSGGISNIAVTNPGTDGHLSITWNIATDATSPPVAYDLYRSSVSAADVWNNLVYSNIATTSKLDSGLTNGQTYWYGVRAGDRIGNHTSNDAQTASGIPSAPGSGCTLCHGIPPSSAASAGSHAAHANSDTDYTDCNKCHSAASTYTTGHSNGSIELGFDGSSVAASYAGSTVSYRDNAVVVYSDTSGYGTLTGTVGDGIDNGTCSSTGTNCHGSATPQWGNAATVSCGSCHGTVGRNYGTDPSTDDDGAPPLDMLDGSTGTRVGKHLTHVNVSYNLTGNSCNLCHNGAGSGTASHADGTPSGGGVAADVAFDTSAGAAGPTATFSAGTCSGLSTSNCHSGSASWNSNAASFPCATCHVYTTHLKLTKGAADAACTACHPGGTSYPTKHSKNANANVIEIPGYDAVGITATPGIHLGGDYTATKSLGTGWVGNRPTTEAEMCWFCHDENGDGVQQPTEATEWGTNFNGTYNEGSLTQAKWIGATWRTAQRANPSFGYKDGAIVSIHTAATSAQGGPTTNTGDTLAQIRCSYCHDVHDRNKALNDTYSGRPYLRGGWKSSPYKQDGAPQSGMVYLNTSAAGTTWGNVPRATSKSNQSMGGYWIDQNSSSPASAWTPEQFGGLCALCHAGTDSSNWTAAGTKTTWSATDIGTINVFEANGVGWVSGKNGHANSVKGGAGAAGDTARNIFNQRGGSTTVANQNPFMHWQGITDPGDNGGGFRGANGSTVYQPTMAGCPTKAASDEWGVDETGVTVQNNYHAFPCSKCHIPHASRLPRLMKTNCLDTKHNTWDNSYPTTTTLNALGTNNTGRSPSNWTTAQNCHRLGGVDPLDTRADVAGTGAGWNTVTPW